MAKAESPKGANESSISRLPRAGMRVDLLLHSVEDYHARFCQQETAPIFVSTRYPCPPDRWDERQEVYDHGTGARSSVAPGVGGDDALVVGGFGPAVAGSAAADPDTLHLFAGDDLSHFR
jgi:hypothetical protein